MNICIVTSTFPLRNDDAEATAGLFIRDFAVEIAKRGHNVSVLTHIRPGAIKESDKITVKRFKWNRRFAGTRLSDLNFLNPFAMLLAIQYVKNAATALSSWIEEGRIDHVLAMWAVPGGFVARSATLRHKITYSVWCLGSDITSFGKNPILRPVVRMVLRDAIKLFADGMSLARDAGHIAGRNCEFLPSCRAIDLHAIEGNIQSENTGFLYVGRFASVKGTDILLDAMESYIRQGGKQSLVMAGGGPLEKFVSHRCSKEPLNGRVEILERFAPTAKILKEMARCRAVVIPSRSESIPLVLGECLRVGRPVIVTDTGDMGILVKSRNAGIVVEPENSDALAAAMMKMDMEPLDSYASGVEKLGRLFKLEVSAENWLEQITTNAGHMSRKQEKCS